MAMSDDAERIRGALLAAALRAHEEAGLRGLCAEGRWEAAVDALRSLDLASALREAPGGAGVDPASPAGREDTSPPAAGAAGGGDPG
jgi:hypothetical protein